MINEDSEEFSKRTLTLNGRCWNLILGRWMKIPSETTSFSYTSSLTVSEYVLCMKPDLLLNFLLPLIYLNISVCAATEMMDYGYPQNTDADILKLVITQKGVMSESNKGRDISVAATGVVNWRAEVSRIIRQKHLELTLCIPGLLVLALFTSQGGHQ